MKRLAAIMIISALILTMSVGSAYAAACVGMVCSPTEVARPVMAAAGCSEMTGAASVVHGICDHDAERQGTKDAVAVQPAMDAALAVAGLPQPASIRPLNVAGASIRGDARGAPHLTSVIRI